MFYSKLSFVTILVFWLAIATIASASASESTLSAFPFKQSKKHGHARHSHQPTTTKKTVDNYEGTEDAELKKKHDKHQLKALMLQEFDFSNPKNFMVKTTPGESIASKFQYRETVADGIESESLLKTKEQLLTVSTDDDSTSDDRYFHIDVYSYNCTTLAYRMSYRLNYCVTSPADNYTYDGSFQFFAKAYATSGDNTYYVLGQHLYSTNDCSGNVTNEYITAMSIPTTCGYFGFNMDYDYYNYFDVEKTNYYYESLTEHGDDNTYYNPYNNNDDEYENFQDRWFYHMKLQSSITTGPSFDDITTYGMYMKTFQDLTESCDNDSTLFKYEFRTNELADDGEPYCFSRTKATCYNSEVSAEYYRDRGCNNSAMSFTLDVYDYPQCELEDVTDLNGDDVTRYPSIFYCSIGDPTAAPTIAPTAAPTTPPSNAPTDAPTKAPTEAPSASPSEAPTLAPTGSPTEAPTAAPTVAPTTASPTAPPTTAPSAPPTAAPTHAPTAPPTLAPTAPPTIVPTNAPTAPPTFAPTAPPTIVPTAAPTETPTAAPTVAPTIAPTILTAAPTATPTKAPTAAPTSRIVDVAIIFPVTQTLSGVTADNFNANFAVNSKVFAMAVVNSTSLLRYQDITVSYAISSTSRKLREANTQSVTITITSAIVPYTITIPSTSNAGFATADDAYNFVVAELTTAVSSGSFDTALASNAAARNATLLASASASTIEFGDYSTISDSDDDEGFPVGGIVGIVIGGVVLIGIIVGIAIYCKGKSPYKVVPNT